MAQGGGKRKRQDRQYSQDEGQGRPSPHRPEAMHMAQQYGQRHDGRGGGGGNTGGGGRRRSRGGQPNYNSQDGQRHVGHGNATGSPSQRNQAQSQSQQQQRHPMSAPENTQMQDRRQVQTPVPSATPQPAREPSPPPEHPAPFTYDYITDDIMATWQETGKQSLKEVLATEDEMVAAIVIQELYRSAVDRRLDPQAAGNLFNEIKQAQTLDPPIDLESLLVDTVQLTDPSDWRRSSFSTFLLASGIPAETWRKTLDEDALKDAGLVRSYQGAGFSQIKARKITNLLYRQQNYNLLREETEGYAKLITEYFNTAMNASGSESPPTIAEDAFQRVKALVGAFDLDVGRVLDITLDVFANLLVRNFRFFVKFIRASSWWPENNIPDAIQWKGQGFDSLPEWAVPGSGDWGMGPEEIDRAARLEPLKSQRDVEFWQRVKDVGIEAFFEIGNKNITNYDSVLELLNTEVKPEYGANKKEMNAIKRIRMNEARKWMRETRTLPPAGNADAAQLLGFKLGFYASPARDKYDVMPENLIFLAALLIKIGFISLRDLYPHLHPPDDKMSEIKEKLEKEVEEKERANRSGGAAKNALARAGALADDMVPAVRNLKDGPASKTGSPKPEGTSAANKAIEEEREKLPEPPDQKTLLLKSLLAIGALPEALFILGKFPWLAELVPEVPEHVHRILHHMLQKVYEPARPLADCSDVSNQAFQVGDSAGLPKGTLRTNPAPPRIVKRWANIDRSDIGEGAAFKFYWDSWADNVPICQTVDDVFLLCGTFLNYSGVKIGKDPLLLTKLVRIGRHSLKDDRSPQNESRWIDLLKRLLVPALSMTSKNPGLVLEVYELLRLFPTATRYSIYAEWHFGPTARLADVKNAFDRTRAETKDVLKRISKTNVRAMGKTLAKVAYASPGIVLQTAINQMESYENLIDVFVECSRYFTLLGYDILTWCLLNALGGANRNRIQADGMLTSSWLRALSTFAGAIFKRYPLCNPAPILQYIADEIRRGDSTDLELLEQLIASLTGIKAGMTYNDAQVLAMAGGEVLQAQTIITLADERHKNEKSSKRLMKALTDAGLAGQLLIAIAQEQQMYTNHTSSQDAPLKVLGSNLDKINQVFVQYLDTIGSNLSIQEFASAVPDIGSLIQDFGLEPGVAFMIGRKNIAHAVAEYDAAKKQEQQGKARRSSTDKVQVNGDTTMQDVDIPLAIKTNADEATAETLKSAEEMTLTNSAADGADIKAEDLKINGVPEFKITSTSSAVSVAPDDTPEPFWHPALTPLVDRMPQILDETTKASMSIPFYVTFWTLGLQDIVVNTASYDQELVYQTQLLNQIKTDRSNLTSTAAREREKKVKAITELKDRLAKEMKAQIGAYTQVRNRLSKEKDHWFGDFHNKIDVLHTSILQNCFLPRILLSPLDAHYTFMMLKFLHNNGTPGFRTMHLVDRLMQKNQLFAIMFQCTSREAENFGRFLNELLKELQMWHTNKNTYEKNAFGTKRQLPGFARKMKADHTPDTFLEFEDFRRLLFKWHGYLNGAITNAFDSGEYMHIRNAIVMLKSVHQHFPAITFIGVNIVKRVEDLGKNESRADLKLAATSLMGDLKKREKTWLMPQQYRLGPGAPPATQAAGSSQPGTPQPARTGTPKPLNAAAPEFKPVDASKDVDEVPPSGPSAEDEDGEIRDEKKPETSGKVDQEMPDIKMELQDSVISKQPAPFAPKEILKRPQPAEARSSSATRAQPADPNPRSSATTATSNARLPPAQSGYTRTTHALPAKPESQSMNRGPPSNRPNERTNTPNTRSDNRNSDDYGRLDRPNDVGRSSSYQDPVRSSHPRSSDRDVPRAPGDRSVARPQQPAGRHADREHGDREYEDRRIGRDQEERRARDSGRNTSQARPNDNKQGLSTNTGALAQNPAAISSNPAPSSENPARLAMIEQENARNSSRDHIRHERDERRDRTSRHSSPGRSDRRAPANAGPDGRRTEQREHSLMQPPATSTPRHDPVADRAPTGPRQDRQPHSESSSRQGSRRPSYDVFDGAQPPRGPSDPSHGRLNSHHDPSYGRLNAPDAPSGPGLPSAPLQTGRNQQQTPIRGGHVVSPSIPLASQTSSQRPASSSAADSISETSGGQTPTGVHPSRVAQLPLGAIQTTTINVPPALQEGLPVGTPTGPSPMSRDPPSGPSSAGGRGNKLFAGIQTALQGGNDRGQSIRGRASRGNGGNGAIVPPTGPASTQHQGPAQSPRIPETGTGPVAPQRSNRVPESPSTPHGPSIPYPPRPEGDYRSAGRPEENGYADRHQYERGHHDTDRRGGRRHDYGPDGRAGHRDDYRDRPEEAERSRHGAEDANNRYRNGPSSAAAYPDQRSFAAAPPNSYGADTRDYPSGVQGPPRPNAGPMYDQRANDGRSGGRGRGGPRDEGPGGYAESPGDRGRDARKRHGDDMNPADSKRRRGGR